MAKLRDLYKPATQAVVNIEGLEIRLAYSTDRLTVNDYRRLEALGEGRERPMSEYGADLVNILARTLVSWDLEDDGEPIGSDLASLEDLPPTVLGEVLAAIFRDMDPKARASSEDSPASLPERTASPSTKTSVRAPRG